MSPGRIRRAMTAVLLISLTGVLFHINLMQDRVSHLEQRFSQLYGTEHGDEKEYLRADRTADSTEHENLRADSIEHENLRADSIEHEHRRADSIEHENRRADSIEHENRRADSIEHENRRADSIEHENRRADSIEHENRKADSIEHEHRRTDSIEHEHRMADSIEHERRGNKSAKVGESQHGPDTDKGSETVADINPHPYSFLINNPGKCENQDVFLLIMVTSAAGNTRQRSDVRKTWGKETNMPGVNIKTVFAIGKAGDITHQTALAEENKAHRDILQEDFADTPRNSSLKTVMCLRWASQFCGNAEFVLKAEDDTFVNLIPLVNHLRDLHAGNTTRLIMGYTYSGTKPLRDPFFIPKWYVSEQEYARDTYPTYPGGFAYVMSNDVLRPLYEVSFKVKYLSLEDVFLGLCAEKLGIELTHHTGFYPIFVDVKYCGLDWLLASRGVSEQGLMWKFWLVINACRPRV
ncbi:PREDICTED: beta-1,3-galactosyltransferase 5-like [Branchiostoma belcheri]|uniref:Hexosyltransferase n=1 Tax=Branchiostoma belcheri TaxID=7741 RepID=A0A6P4ZIT4_BRABE|nr:PREDICTED: beta-1,3-galactosyltransferase 5-like [Branchiostoma belcheri]